MKLRTFFFLASLIGILAHDGTAQTQTPDCSQGGSALTFTGAGNGPALVATTGGGAGCSTIALTWYVTGFSAATIHLQGSQDNSSWADITSTALILEGSNPTSWTSGTTSNRIVVRAFLPYFRMTVDGLTGSGTVQGQIYGYKGSSPAPIAETQDIIIIGNGTVLSGQQAVTGSAVALASNATKSVCVKANLANTINVYVGPSGVSTSTGLELPPGGGACILVTNTNLLYVVASTTGASVSWLASN